MGRVAVFHHIGGEQDYSNSLEEILAFDGQITFDGVYESVFAHRVQLADKEPILFITGNQIGREGFCNKEQLLEMRNYGFALGWHGWSHDQLTKIPRRQVHSELTAPDWIEPVYAYPHGEFNAEVKEIIKGHGYWKAYSTTQGDDSEFAIKREYI